MFSKSFIDYTLLDKCCS